MAVNRLKVVNFRSYCATETEFAQGLNIVVGANATGKTNLLEAAWFALRASSPRTKRDEKLVRWGADFLRVELWLVDEAGDAASEPVKIELGYAPRAGKRVRWGGVEVTSLDELRERQHVFIFVPESLLLIKGSPARRRAHIDAFAAGVDRRYAQALCSFQEILRQRNAQLQMVRGGADERALEPWDRQFAAAACELIERRRDLIDSLNPLFSAAAAALAPEGARYELRLGSQMAAVELDSEVVTQELRRRRPGEIARGMSLFGPQRDDLVFAEVGGESISEPAGGGAVCDTDLPTGGRDLRLFGSQGEQRLAVLALLLAERELAENVTGRSGILFLDDVMSELDDDRRRRLMKRLRGAGQVVVTTTNRHYFTAAELESARVIELPLEEPGNTPGGEQVGSALTEPEAAPGVEQSESANE